MPGLTAAERRRAMYAGHWNAALWGAGSALTTGPLINFLAHDLGARGRIGGLLMALPALVGVLRLIAPGWIRYCGSTKTAAVRAFFASYGICCGLPLVGVLAPLVGGEAARGLLLGILLPYHLTEYLGSVALWTWFGELVPLRIRGRYFARRQVWQLAALIPVAVSASWFTDQWRSAYANDPEMMLWGYAGANGLGAVCLLLSLIPLSHIPRRPLPASAARMFSIRQILTPLRSLRFGRLLVFRGWFSFANGISQYAQNIFPKQVLKLGVSDLMLMSSGMRVGQTAVSPAIGKWCDRIGVRPVLVVCQAIVAAALMFFLLASGKTHATAWVLSGAYVCFIAYAGHNIGLPTLTLKLADAADKSPYVAVCEALGSLCHAGGTILGGFFFDWLVERGKTESAGSWEPFATLFVVGFVARLLAVPLAGRLRDDRECAVESR